MVHVAILLFLFFLWRIALKSSSVSEANSKSDEEGKRALLEARFCWDLAIITMCVNTIISLIFTVYLLYRTRDYTLLSIMRSEYVAIQTFTTIGYGNYTGHTPEKYHHIDYLMHNFVMLSTSVAWAIVISSLTGCVQSVARFKSKR